MKTYPTLTNYIEAVSALTGRMRTLPKLSPLLDDNSMPHYRTKGGMLFFPVVDSEQRGFMLGFFLNGAVHDKFSAKPNQRFLTEELYVHTSIGGVYVDVVLSSDSGAVADKRVADITQQDYNSNRELVEGFKAFQDSATGLWGYQDASGKEFLKPCWQAVDDFAEGRAVVQADNMFGLIDTSGNLVIAAEFDELSWDGSQYAYCERQGEWGVIDRNGNTILPLKWEWIGDFSHNFFIVQQNQLFGFANQDGQIIIEPKYHDAGSFNQFGAAWVRLDDKEFFIDSQERRV